MALMAAWGIAMDCLIDRHGTLGLNTVFLLTVIGEGTQYRNPHEFIGI